MGTKRVPRTLALAAVNARYPSASDEQLNEARYGARDAANRERLSSKSGPLRCIDSLKLVPVEFVDDYERRLAHIIERDGGGLRPPPPTKSELAWLAKNHRRVSAKPPEKFARN